MTNPYQVRMQEAADRIRTVVEGLFADLDQIRDLAIAQHDRARAAGRPFRSADLGALRPTLFDRLHDREGLVAGTGVIAAPEALEDVPRFLEWWEGSPGSEPRFLRVDLDPDSVDFYDYTAAEWFETPRRTRYRSIVGPYVDYGGTDEYILTLTVPVATAETFLGVAGADVPAARLESVVLPLLHLVDAETVLVNGAGRVVASNTARKIVGSLLKGVTLDELVSEGGATAAGEAPAVRCGRLPWALVILETSPTPLR